MSMLVEQAAIDAGLRHELPWATVARILAQLPVEHGCPYCGGWLDRIGQLEDEAWRCRACGRITTDRDRRDDSRPNRAKAEELGREACESWQRVEERIARRSAA